MTYQLNHIFKMNLNKIYNKGAVMTIEEIIEMVKDFKRVANTEEEAKKLEEKFIKNFKNEYEIIEK